MEKYISEEIRFLNWQNKVPVIVTLALDEINGIENPPALVVRIENSLLNFTFWFFYFI